MKFHSILRNVTVIAVILAVVLGCSKMPDKPDLETLSQSAVYTRISVHDPSIVADGEGADRKYYIFGSHMDSAVSSDLIEWEQFTSGVSRYNKLFGDVLVNNKAFEYVGRNDQGSYSVWAPDAIYNPVMDKYMMYISTTSTYIKSSIALTLSDSLTGPYDYAANVIYSGFTRQTIDQTDVIDIVGEENSRKYLNFSRYNNQNWPNAIDPALFYDEDGRLWMTYGSWSGGAFILEIDLNTGLPIHPEENLETRTDPYFGRHIGGGLHNSFEGPYIIYDDVSGYYYFFISYGWLESEGGYQIRLYRSENPDGPYVDSRGQSLTQDVLSHSEHGVKMMGNYSFPSLAYAYMAPGHNSAIVENGEIFLVYHVRFNSGGENHEPRVHKLYRTSNGWLAAAPFGYDGNEQLLTGLNKGDIPGYYYMVNHGQDISAEIHDAVETRFMANGKILDAGGDTLGEWDYESSTGYVNINVGDENFTGVYLEQNDEAGNKIQAVSAVSNYNQTIWAVRYEQE